jgi:bacitracin transport system permease protein
MVRPIGRKEKSFGMDDSSTGKVTYKDVYESFRSPWLHEITILWQRAVMFGVFVALAYTGYGMVLGNALEKGACRWEAFNLVCIGLACFGMVMSLLWIIMMKGSKAWYERYEVALNAFIWEGSKHQGEIFQDARSCELAREGMLGKWQEDGYPVDEKPTDKDPLTGVAGRFSVSRATIVFGQVSFFLWMALAFLHSAALFLGEGWMLRMTGAYAKYAGLFMIVSVMVVVLPTIVARTESKDL